MSDDFGGVTVLDNSEITNQPGYLVTPVVSSSGIVLGDNNVVEFTPVLPYHQTDLGEAELQRTLIQLREKVEQYFDIIAETLHENPTLQEETLKTLQDIKEDIRVITGDEPLSSIISQAQFKLRCAHVAIPSVTIIVRQLPPII